MVGKNMMMLTFRRSHLLKVIHALSSALMIMVSTGSPFQQTAAVVAFSPILPTTCSFYKTRSHLFMGKGNAQKKQADLAKKMELAKKQNTDEDPAKNESILSVKETTKVDKEELKRQEDLAIFAKLLTERKHQPPIENSDRPQQFIIAPLAGSKSSSSSSSLKPKQTSKELKRRKKKSKEQNLAAGEPECPLQQGDVAKRIHFEQLFSMENMASSSQPLGPIGAAQLVPWVPPYLTNYLMVLADPRKHSGDLRQAILYLTSNLALDILPNVVVITSDSNEETSKWMSKAGVDTPIRVFSDETLGWMKANSAVVEDERWSMSLFMFDTSGTIRELIRQVDPAKASQLVTNMCQCMEEE